MARRRRPSIPVPTGWFALLVALSAVPLVALRTDAWILVPLVLGLLAVLATIDVLSSVPPAQIVVEREFPPTVPVGDSAEIVWRVRSTAPRPTTVTVADALWPSLGATRRR